MNYYTGGRFDIPVGDGAGHGAGAGVPQAVGLRARGRDHLGEDQPAAAHHPHGPDRALAQPRQGALSRRRQRHGVAKTKLDIKNKSSVYVSPL